MGPGRACRACRDNLVYNLLSFLMKHLVTKLGSYSPGSLLYHNKSASKTILIPPLSPINTGSGLPRFLRRKYHSMAPNNILGRATNMLDLRAFKVHLPVLQRIHSKNELLHKPKVTATMPASSQRRTNLPRLARNKVMDGDQLAIGLDLAPRAEDLGLLGADAMRKRRHVEICPFGHSPARFVVVPGYLHGLVVAHVVVRLEDAPAIPLARRHLVGRGVFCIVLG